MDNNLNYTYFLIQEDGSLDASYTQATVTIKPHMEALPQPSGNNQLVILVDLDLGSRTSCEILMEGSPDGITWYPETVATVSASAQVLSIAPYQMTVTGKYRIPVQIKDSHLRVSFKGTGGSATGSSLTMGAVVGVS